MPLERIDDSSRDGRERVRRHLDQLEQRIVIAESKLDEVLAIISAGKIGGAVIKWITGMAITVIGAYATYRGIL